MYMHSHYILLWSCIFIMKKKYSTFALSLCLCTLGKTQKNEFALIVLFSAVPLLIVLNFRTPPFSEHDWMKIIYEPLFILNWSLTVDYMKSATRVELVIELMSVRNESFAWVSFLILTVILYQTSIFVMTVMRIKCQCSLWVEFIPPKNHGLITKRQCELYSAYSLFIHCLDWKFFLMLYSASIYILSFFVPIVNIPMYNCTVLM